jgi:hypothetical protein
MTQMPEPAELADTPPAGAAEPDTTPVAATTTAPDISAVGQPAVGASDLPEPSPAPASSMPAHLAPSPTRMAVGIVLGAAVAALGGWILGEYPFTGIMPYITGVLFALVVAEVILSVSRSDPSRLVAAVAAVITAAGIGLAVWIQSTEGLVAIPPGGWVAISLGFVVALVRGGIRVGGRPKGNSPPPS